MIQVAVGNLSNWLSNQLPNTPLTPYQIEITGISSSNYTTIKTALQANPTKFVDLSETTITITSSMTGAGYELFQGCGSLIYPPKFSYSWILGISFERMFYGCVRLESIADIPSAVTDVKSMYQGCSRLKDARLIHGHTRKGIAIYHGTGYEKGDSFTIPLPTANGINKYFADTLAKSISGNDFTSDYSTSDGYTLSENVNIVERLDNDVCGRYGYETSKYRQYLVKKGTKYFIMSGLSYYEPRIMMLPIEQITIDEEGKIVIPEQAGDAYTVTNLYSDSSKTTSKNDNIGYWGESGLYQTEWYFENNETFYAESSFDSSLNGTYTVIANDAIIQSVRWIDYTKTTSIPSNLTSMPYMFADCISLKNIPDIPSNITNLFGTFVGCEKLEDIDLIPSTVTSMQKTFSGCTSLKSIKEWQIPLATLRDNTNFADVFKDCTALESIGYKVEESDKWHFFRLKFGANTVEGEIFDKDGNITTIPQTSITKTTLKLPVKTDEVWFPILAELDADIDDAIADVINTRYSYFKKTVVPPNGEAFVLWAKKPNNFRTNLPIAGSSIPVGFIMAQYKKVNTNGWLYLDGSTFDANVYPNLYAYLGTNVLPDYREFALVGAEENTTDTIATHDVYTEGQAKDDALQNITGYFQIRKMSNGANAVTSRSGAFTLSDQSSQADGFDFSGGEGKIHRVSFNSKNVTRNDANANVTRGKRKAVYFYIKAM